MRIPFVCKVNKNNDFIQQFLLIRVNLLMHVHESTRTHVSDVADAGAGVLFAYFCFLCAQKVFS